MRKGFTLLELMVVIIIVGVMATLGVMQYQGAVERSRGAEARQIIGQLRSECAADLMADGATTNCDEGNVPTACAATHFFAYAISANALDDATFTATRCTASGKTPNYTSADTLTLVIDYDGTDASDTWGGTGTY